VQPPLFVRHSLVIVVDEVDVLVVLEEDDGDDDEVVLLIVDVIVVVVHSTVVHVPLTQMSDALCSPPLLQCTGHWYPSNVPMAHAVVWVPSLLTMGSGALQAPPHPAIATSKDIGLDSDILHG
jgi:hypothetical protein